MSEQSNYLVVTQPVDTPTIPGVKCIQVKPPSWKDVLIGQLANMMGPHPRWAIVVWDGSAFQFREAKNISVRVAPE